MINLLNEMTGKRVDVICAGGVGVRGEVMRIIDGVVYMRDEDERVCYVALDKVVIVYESKDKEPRAGFLAGAMK